MFRSWAGNLRKRRPSPQDVRVTLVGTDTPGRVGKAAPGARPARSTYQQDGVLAAGGRHARRPQTCTGVLAMKKIMHSPSRCSPVCTGRHRHACRRLQ